MVSTSPSTNKHYSDWHHQLSEIITPIIDDYGNLTKQKCSSNNSDNKAQSSDRHSVSLWNDRGGTNKETQSWIQLLLRTSNFSMKVKLTTCPLLVNEQLKSQLCYRPITAPNWNAYKSHSPKLLQVTLPKLLVTQLTTSPHLQSESH